MIWTYLLKMTSDDVKILINFQKKTEILPLAKILFQALRINSQPFRNAELLSWRLDLRDDKLCGSHIYASFG